MTLDQPSLRLTYLTGLLWRKGEGEERHMLLWDPWRKDGMQGNTWLRLRTWWIYLWSYCQSTRCGSSFTGSLRQLSFTSLFMSASLTGDIKGLREEAFFACPSPLSCDLKKLPAMESDFWTSQLYSRPNWHSLSPSSPLKVFHIPLASSQKILLVPDENRCTFNKHRQWPSTELIMHADCQQLPHHFPPENL